MLFRALFVCILLSGTIFAVELRTLAELSNYGETGRYNEVEKLCAAFEATFPKRVKCLTFGTTPQGRPMLALVASNDETLKGPVVLAQGGIHAGEIDGKDAGFRVLRDLLEEKILPGALSKLTFVFVPVFNIDGHERFGPNNRPNQNGPKEMGFRATGQNYNLNRDYMKAHTPEMRAMLKLLHDFDPVIYADLHVTDGADFQHDISITMQPTHSQDEQLQEIGRSIQQRVIADLNVKGAKALDFYPDFVKNDDPSSGFAISVPPPRFSTSYWSTRGRYGVLVETHSWKDYKSRVQRTYDTLISLLEQTMTHGAKWLSEFKKAEDRDSRLAGKAVVLSWRSGQNVKTIDFLGYAYTRTPSAISGSIKIHYDRSRPKVLRIPLKDSLVPDLTVTAPKGGYIVPQEWAELVANRLSLHKIAYQRLDKPVDKLQTSQFRASSWQWAPQSFEGRQTLTALEGTWEKGPTHVAKGGLFVPISQPKARLLMALIEPQAPDSFAFWGDFNPVFEQKEYMETYVTEVVAEKMLANDNGLMNEFVRKLETDPKFAASPSARLDFFYKRHPFWDTHIGVYPIMRIDELGQLSLRT